jgi:hypothetical protein
MESGWNLVLEKMLGGSTRAGEDGSGEVWLP